MDLHSMKRRELQALCKKHKIPANLSNNEMANRLAKFLMDEDETAARGPSKGEDNNGGVAETIDVVPSRKVKKVRFSPEHELIEFTRSRRLKRRSRRTSAFIGSSILSVEEVSSGDMNNEDVGRQGRVTRSRVTKLIEGNENEKKTGGNGVKCPDQKDGGDSIENLANSVLGETDVNNSRRVTRLRGKVVVGGAQNEIKQERKRPRNVDKRDQETLNNTDGNKLNEEVVDAPVRLTRSRGHKPIEEAKKEEKRWKNVENNKDAPPFSAELGDGVEVITRNRKNSRNVKRVESKSREGKQVMDSQEITEENAVVEPPNKLRRSKRNTSRLGDSEICNDDTKTTDNGGSKGTKKMPKLFTVPRMVGDHTGNKVDLDRGVVIEAEEEENAELQAQTEKRYPLNSVQQLRTAFEVSEQEVPQPAKFVTRSRRATLSLKPVPSVGMERYTSKPCLPQMEKHAVRKNTRRSTRNASKSKSSETVHDLDRDCIIQPENEAKEQNESSIPKYDMNASNDDPSTFSTREENGRKKASAAAAATVASSQEGFLEIKNSSFLDARLPVPVVAESTEDPGLTSDTSSKNISNDFGLISSRKSSTKRKDVTIDVAGSADSGMQLINRNEVEIVHGLSEFDIQKSAELCIAGKDKNDPELQIFDQAEDLDYNKIPDSEVLPEGSSVPMNMSFAETGSSADSFIPSDQADFQIDLEATQGEEGKHAQTSLAVPVNVCEINGVPIPENLDFAECFDVINALNNFQHNDVDSLESSNKSYKSNDDDKILKTREAIAFESYERHNGPVTSRSELKPNGISSSKINENDEGGRLKDCEVASIEENGFCLSDLFDGERSTGIIPQYRGISQAKEGCMITNDDTYINNSMLLESAKKTSEGEASENRKSDCSNEYGEFMSNLFDAERRESITSGDKAFSAEYSTKNSNDKGSPSIKETTPKSNVSESQETEGGAGVDTMQKEENFICRGILPGEEMSTVGTLSDGDCELANQDNEGNENICESVYPSSPLVDSVPDPVQEHEACSNASENGHKMSISTTNGQGKTGLVDEVNHTKKANDAIWDNTMGGCVDACATYETISIPMPEVVPESHSKSECEKMEETEYQSKDSLTNHTLLGAGEETGDAKSSQSSTGIDLNDLFGKKVDGTSFMGLNHTPQGSEVTKTLPVSDRLAKRDTVMMETERSESAKTMSAGCSVGMETNLLKLLFSTPCNADGISYTNRKFDETAVSLKAEGPDTMWQNMETQMRLDEEMGHSKGELENSLSLEILASDNTYAELNKVESVEYLSNANCCEVHEGSEEQLTSDACEFREEELNDVESVELVNTCTASEAEYKVSEASKEILTENTCECREENNCSTKVPLEAEYDIDEVYEQQLMENICTTKVPRENDLEVCEASVKPLTENTCEPREENIFTIELTTEAESTVPEVSKEQLAKGTCCEFREEKELIGGESMNAENDYSTEVPQDAEFDAYEASEDQVTENGCDHKSEIKLDGSIEFAGSCMIQVPSVEGMKEQLTENTCGRRGEIESNEVENIDLGSPCMIQVPSVEGMEEQMPENTCQCREETELSEVENVELVNVCEVSGEQLTDYACENRGETGLPELEDADLINTCIAEVLLIAENDAHEVSEQRLNENTNDSTEEIQSIVESLEEKIFTLEHCNQHEEAANNGGESRERIISASSGNLNDVEVYSDMLMDAEYSENCNCRSATYANSIRELAQRSEVELELSNANLQKPNISVDNHYFSACYADENISREASLDNPSLRLDAERAISASLGIENDSIDKGQDSPVCVVQSEEDILSSSAMHLLFGDDGVGGVTKSDGVLPFSTETDQEMDGTDINENSTPEIVPFSISKVHLEAESENVSASECNNVQSVPDVPVSGCDEILKESDVADTIKEYIDSESSLAADLDDSTPTEALGESANFNEILLPISNPDNINPPVEIELEEREEATLSTELTPGLTIALKSPVRVNLLEEGATVVDASLDTKLGDSHKSPSKQLYTNEPKAARTILIHGTPRKQLAAVDMKENAFSHKTSNIGDITTVRPKRKALKDVQWK